MARPILPEPPDDLKRLSRALQQRLHDAMGPDGEISFARFMEMALYEPGLGYYSAGLHKLGAAGDFVTAPELGDVFGACLARQAREVASGTGDWDILEIGAGSGRLAATVLRELDAADLPRRYAILERSADLRAVQRKTLADAVPDRFERVTWLDRPPTESWRGLVLANEVLDALAVERFEIRDGDVRQLCVRATDDGFRWSTRAAPAALEAQVRHLEADIGAPFADGYRSEIQLHLPAWLDSVTERLEQGLALFIDYGYPRREYYRAERRDGTLMCHYRHRAHDDVFFWPGLQDLTAWVDFTALAEAADRCGLDVDGYTSQAMFLAGCGLESVLENRMTANGAALAAEVRQLTLPGLMGERFQVMGLGRGLEREPRGFSLLDLRYRL
ncbi:MAG: SAM-dependent methyltransferase [Xanthomonadales bacterium]